MSIEDAKAKAIKVRLGEPLLIRYPSTEKTETIPLFPNDLPDHNYNHNGAAICFVAENTMYILPFHGENYVELLEEAGFERNKSLYVPFSDGLSYPENHKEQWLKMMETSRKTA